MTEMKGEYGGYVIKWDDFHRHFTMEKDGTQVKVGLPSIEDCEKWIDQRNKRKYKRVAVICRDNWRDKTFRLGEATSVVGDDEAWVSIQDKKGKERRKTYIKNIYLDTPENRQKLNDLIKASNEAAALEKQADAILATMTRLTVNMMLEEGETE